MKNVRYNAMTTTNHSSSLSFIVCIGVGNILWSVVIGIVFAKFLI